MVLTRLACNHWLSNRTQPRLRQAARPLVPHLEHRQRVLWPRGHGAERPGQPTPKAHHRLDKWRSCEQWRSPALHGTERF